MKTLLLLAMMAVIAFASTPSFAQGASNLAPGQKMRDTPRKEDKGASIFAPGQKAKKTTVKEPKGASTLAPGQTRGQESKKDKR